LVKTHQIHWIDQLLKGYVRSSSANLQKLEFFDNSIHEFSKYNNRDKVDREMLHQMNNMDRGFRKYFNNWRIDILF
jgi:hypothetical protein